ncbi:MAG: Gldg family protein [Deltaproteobacteria bacterium]|nr:Gldg family protein [Deltaproteobacteria bacterium]
MAPIESAPNQRILAAWPNLLGGLALLAAFVSLRLLDEGARTAGLVITGLAAVGALAGRARGRMGADAAGRRYALWATLPDLLVLVGAALCGGAVLTEDPPALVLPLGVLAAVLGGAQVVALELVSAPMRATGFIDLRRVRAALNTASTLVLAVAGLGALCFALDKLDMRRDFSFAAPTTPSAATLSLLDAAQCPAPAPAKDEKDAAGAAGAATATGRPELFLFFERGSAALGELRDYFDALADHGVAVTTQDAAIDPALAKKMKVSKNGTVGLRCGERTETWQVGEDREDASKKLGKLDEEMRTRLAKVSKDPVTVYFTVGHGERSFDDAAKPGERVTAKTFKKLVESTNAKVKKLGVADGLTKEVPADAELVVLVGPTQPFLDEEVQALKAYWERGGALLVMVDPPIPGAEVPALGTVASLEPLLATLGVQVGEHEVVNDKAYVKESGGKADQAFVFSTSFGSHKSVKTLSGARGKAALLFKQTATVEKRQKDAGKVSVLARSAAGSFVDKSGDRAFTEGSETRAILDLAAAVELPATGGGKEGRAVVLGDSDAVADFLLVNSEANQVFGYEMLVWLLRDDDKIVGDAASSGDVRILHTRDQDKLWFYGTVFLAPLLLIGVGAFVGARRRRRPAKAAATPATGGTP